MVVRQQVWESPARAALPSPCLRLHLLWRLLWHVQLQRSLQLRATPLLLLCPLRQGRRSGAKGGQPWSRVGG